MPKRPKTQKEIFERRLRDLKRRYAKKYRAEGPRGFAEVAKKEARALDRLMGKFTRTQSATKAGHAKIRTLSPSRRSRRRPAIVESPVAQKGWIGRGQSSVVVDREWPSGPKRLAMLPVGSSLPALPSGSCVEYTGDGLQFVSEVALDEGAWLDALERAASIADAARDASSASAGQWFDFYLITD